MFDQSVLNPILVCGTAVLGCTIYYLWATQDSYRKWATKEINQLTERLKAAEIRALQAELLAHAEASKAQLLLALDNPLERIAALQQLPAGYPSVDCYDE